MKIRLAVAQYPISAHTSFTSWQQHTQNWVNQAVQQNAKVLLFPEYGSMELVSLFDEKTQKSLPLQIQELQSLLEQFKQTYQKLAEQYQVAILAPSIPVIDKAFAKPVNRAFFFFPDGKVGYQDKKHMTRFEDEVWGVGTGDPEQRIFQVFGILFGVNICFDVEFPYAATELAEKGVQVLLAPSCTETMKGLNRVHIGSRARAMENQYYVAVAQTVGNSPWSEAVDINTGLAACYATCDLGFPDDGILMQGQLNQESWYYCDLDTQLIDQVRDKGQVFNFKNMRRVR